MPDRDHAPDIARYLLDEEWDGPDQVFAAVLARWPDLTRGEWDRGAAIARELATLEALEARIEVLDELRASGSEHP